MSVPRVVRRPLALLVAVVICASLTSCSTTPSSTTSSGSTTSGLSESTNAAVPKTLTVATSFAVDDLDPIDNGYWGNELGYGELLMKPQSGGTVTPWLLKSLTNTSPTSWVLTLNSGIHFQDGAPLDAAALVAGMDYQIAQNSSVPAALPGITLSVTGPDQVTLTTTSPVPDVPFILGDEDFFIIYDQAAYLAAKGSPSKLIAGKIYTGPYVVTSLSPQVMQLTRNPDYWDGTPALQRVTVKFITDADARILAVQHGEADLALYPPTTAARTLTGRSDSYYVTGAAHGPTFLLFLNQHRAPFDDVAVRKAVQEGIDYDQLANQVMNGLYQPATGMYGSSAPYAVATQKTDTHAAAALLDQAGWVTGSSGTRVKDGASLAFTIDTYAAQPDTQTLAVALQAQLRAIGFDVSVSQVPDIDAAQKSPTGWTAALEGDGTTSFSGDPITALQEYWASKVASNTTGIDDPTLDGLVGQLSQTLDQNASNELLRQIQQRIADNADNVFVGQRLPAVIVGPTWKGYHVPPANLWVGPTTTPTG